MAKMKWIYSMVQDGTYTAFKHSQMKAKKDKILSVEAYEDVMDRLSEIIKKLQLAS